MKEAVVNKITALLFFSFLFTIRPGYSHTLTGLTGLMNVPSAVMQKDGSLFFGVSYLNHHHTKVFHAEYNRDVLAYYANLTFLPFVEMAFRNSGPLNVPGKAFQVDRMFSARIQLLKEYKHIPSFVFGAHDFLSTSRRKKPFFGAIYTVATKHFNIVKNNLGLTVGYGFDYFKHNQFEGLFGGLTFTPSFLPQIKLMVEHDSKVINIGSEFILFNRLELLGVLQDWKNFSGNLAFKILL